MMPSLKTKKPSGDSERSPSVYYANWKETMLLQKQLTTLNRTERGLVHRITVDQKVTFRRFQTKLHRSKIAHARMWGDKEREQSLRGVGMQKLNSDIQGEDENGFLKKLQQRPYVVDYHDKALQKFSKPKGEKLVTLPKLVTSEENHDVTDKDMTNIIKAVMKEQTIPHTSHNLRSLSALGNILDCVKRSEGHLACGQMVNDSTPRPATTHFLSVGEHVTSVKKFEGKPAPVSAEPSAHPLAVTDGLQASDHTDSICSSSEGSETSHLTKNDTNDVDGKADNTGPSKSDKKKAKNRRIGALDNIQLTDNDADPVNFPQSPPPGPRTLRPPEFPKSRKSSSIFEEVKRLDLRQVHLNEVRSIDHTEAVQAFCESIRELGPGVPDFDYYASKMQATAAEQTKDTELVSIPGTPDDDYRKYTGDTTIKCITMGTVHLKPEGTEQVGLADEVSQWLVLDGFRQSTPNSEDARFQDNTSAAE